MIKKIVILLTCTLPLSAAVESSAPTRLGHTILHKADYCDIRTSGKTVLRCVGTSGIEVQNQLATLIFSCFLKQLTVSLGHAAVANEVRTYRFVDSSGNSEADDDQTPVSRVRTSFSRPYNDVPHWIFQNVMKSKRIYQLDFSLNVFTNEVQGRFFFTENDRELFFKFEQFCREKDWLYPQY